jgi:NlpC/P60 family putative phage cell wall peptidase
MIYRAQIADEARQWVGTPWRHQASLKGIGCDCIGLVRGVARALGLTAPFATGAARRYAGYGRTPDPEMLLEACGDYLDPGRGDLGDVLLLRFEREPQHFALISNLKPRRMIHSYAQARKAVENGIDHVWMGRIVRVYSFRGIA